MTPALLESILAHARSEAPREACGLLVWDGKFDAVYHPCRNIFPLAEECFEIAPEDWIAAEDAGKVLGVVHSHPCSSVEPSRSDQQECDRSALPWWIVDLEGHWNRITPKGWTLTGHPFAWGVQDCSGLARDYTGCNLDFTRDEPSLYGENLFEKHLSNAGFELVTDGPRPGDVLLMSLKAKGIANHCAIYIGEGQILHHMVGRLSRKENLGPLNRAVVGVARRKS